MKRSAVCERAVVKTQVSAKYTTDIQRETEDNLSPLNIYLWLHFCGFTAKLRCSRRSIANFVFSMALSIIIDGFRMYSLIGSLSSLGHNDSKLSLTSLAIQITNLFLRVAVAVKRRRLNFIIKQSAKIHATIATENGINIKTKLVLCLVAKDIISLSVSWHKFSEMNASNFLGDDFRFLFFSPPYSTLLFYIFTSLSLYSGLLGFVTIYFCCVCHVLKRTLVEFKKTVSYKRSLNTDYLLRVYNEITTLVSSVNVSLQELLTTVLIINLTVIFYGSYHLLFLKFEPLSIKLPVLAPTIISFLQFAVLCLFASSVTKAATEVNEMICQLPFNANQKKNLQFFLRANNKFVGFTLFDSIVIDKSLILSAVGSLLSYGIMIATFNTKT